MMEPSSKPMLIERSDSAIVHIRLGLIDFHGFGDSEKSDRPTLEEICWRF
jgi:hypothetical protein